MAVIAGKDGRHQDDQGPEGQAGRDLAGLDAGGRSSSSACAWRACRSRTSSRSACSFSEMPIALARGDIDAYVGAEPGPGVSLASGIGKLVEYPYSHADGRAEHDRSARIATRWRDNPKLREGDRSTCTARPSNTPWRTARDRSRWRSPSSARSGSDRDVGAERRADLEVRRDEIMQRAKTYAEHMLSN